MPILKPTMYEYKGKFEAEAKLNELRGESIENG